MEDTQSWLNEDYIGEILKASIGNTGRTTIVNYNTKKAVAQGKNYSSTVYRVQVQYKHNTDEIKQKNYMIKRLIPEAVDWFGSKETLMYSQVLPKIEQHNIINKIVPKVYKYNATDMVMEDLGDLGFRTCELKLLDYEHCSASLQALARYHAGTVLLHSKDPKLIETVGYETFSKDNQIEFFRLNISRLGDEISTWPLSRYCEGVRSIAEQTKDYFGALPKRNTFRVLNHGDFWLNNILFRYDCGKVDQVRLVDFQVCRYAPPTCDVQYFIGSSADLDVRRNRLDELLAVYLNTLNVTLAALGLGISLSMEQFEEDMRLDYPMYFLGVTLPLTVLLADPDNTMSVEGMEGNVEVACDRFGNLMKSKLFKEFLPEVLVDLDKRGVFREVT